MVAERGSEGLHVVLICILQGWLQIDLGQEEDWSAVFPSRSIEHM